MTKTEPHQDWQTDANPALPHWQATVLTLFPDMFPGHLAHSLAGKSLNEGIWALKTLDIRDFARDKHRTVDDTPLGGGVGMVLKPDVVAAALAAVAGLSGPATLPVTAWQGAGSGAGARSGRCQRGGVFVRAV